MLLSEAQFVNPFVILALVYHNSYNQEGIVKRLFL